MTLATTTDVISVSANVATAIALLVAIWQLIIGWRGEQEERLHQRAEAIRADLRRVLDASSTLRRAVGFSSSEAQVGEFGLEAAFGAPFLWAEFAECAADVWIPRTDGDETPSEAIERLAGGKERFAMVAAASGRSAGMRRLQSALDNLDQLTATLPGEMSLLSTAMHYVNATCVRFADPAYLAEGVHALQGGLDGRDFASLRSLRSDFRDDFIGWTVLAQRALLPKLDAQLGFIESVARALLDVDDAALDRVAHGSRLDDVHDAEASETLASLAEELHVPPDTAATIRGAVALIVRREAQFADHMRATFEGATPSGQSSTDLPD